MPLRKKLKGGRWKTAHVDYVKRIYHMLVLFEVLRLSLFFNTHSGAVHEILSYEGSFLRDKALTILIHMILSFSNSFSLSILKGFNLLFLSLFVTLSLNFLTYPLILGNTKTKDLINLSKYPTKYLELVFVSTNFEINILSTLISRKTCDLDLPLN